MCSASEAQSVAPSNSAASASASTAANAQDHFDTAHTILGTVIGETFGYLLTAAWTMLVVTSLGNHFSGRIFKALGTVSAGMIVVGVFSPLDLAVVDKVNFGGYVLWSVWLIWLAVAVVKGRGFVWSDRPPAEKDELAPGPVGSVANLDQLESFYNQRVLDLGATAEAQGGDRLQHEVVTAERGHRPKGD